MLIKKMPSHLYVLVENNYRHEHVMITKLYIVVNILYDSHLYDASYEPLAPAQKKPWVVPTPPLV